MNILNKEQARPYLIWLAVTLAIKAIHLAFKEPGGTLMPLFTGVLLLYSPLIYCWLRGEKVGYLSLKKPGKSIYWLMALFTLSALTFGLGVKLTGGTLHREKAEMLFTLPSVKFWATSLLVTSFPEEFFFRGFLFDRVGESRVQKIVITSLLFSITHIVMGFSLIRLLTFFPGAILAINRDRTGEIYTPTILHTLFNMMQWITSK